MSERIVAVRGGARACSLVHRDLAEHRGQPEEREESVGQRRGGEPEVEVELHRVERIEVEDRAQVGRLPPEEPAVAELAEAGLGVGERERRDPRESAPAVERVSCGAGFVARLGRPAPTSPRVDREAVAAREEREHRHRVQRHEAGVVRPGGLPHQARDHEVERGAERHGDPREGAEGGGAEHDEGERAEDRERARVTRERVEARDRGDQREEPVRIAHRRGERGGARDVLPRHAHEEDRRRGEAEEAEDLRARGAHEALEERCEPETTRFEADEQRAERQHDRDARDQVADEARDHVGRVPRELGEPRERVALDRGEHEHVPEHEPDPEHEQKRASGAAHVRASGVGASSWSRASIAR